MPAARVATSAGSTLLRLVVTIALLAFLAWALNRGGLGDLTGAASTTDTSAIPATSADERALVAAAKTAAATVKVDAGTDGKGYSRSQFGDGWKTVKGCDMRNRTLARDLADDVFKPGTRDCVVTGGVLAKDIYSGKRVTFVKGGSLANSLDIDHIHALSAAWSHGAADWTPQQREAFANDPANLLAVDAATNRSKGDDGPSEWLPVKSGRCVYVAKFTIVTAKYRLSVTEADKKAIDKVLASC